MFEFVTPHRLFRTQIHTLRETLPGVLDGLASGVHDARIATRRIREVLPLLGDPKKRKPIADLSSRFKRLGKSLGRVRDVDVRIALLASLETRLPHAAPSLVVLRQQRERERLKLVRKLIKRLERLEAVRLIEMLDDHHFTFPTTLAWTTRAGSSWRRDLKYTLSERARATNEAIDHATGVYFPRRAHAARIAIKKLRYALEIAHETGRADLTAAIRELKKTQDLLGDLHDRQELLDDLTETAGQDQSDNANQVALVRQMIDAECHDIHSRYLARRSGVQEICRGESRVRPHLSALPAPALIGAGALALSSGIYAVSMSSRQR
jgi:CHAD domain-containing protein